MKEEFSQRTIAASIGANGDPKRNAVADFASRLLNSPMGPHIARIVLFGSVSRDEARPKSDVDVLVFGAVSRRSLSYYAAQAAWEASVEWGEQVAQLTYTLNDLLQPRSYLLYNALRQGQEVYSMDETQIRHLEAQNISRKAERHLAQAQRAAAQNDFELAIVGAYTAAELAVKALILLKPGLELPSTHGGMLPMFGREYIKTGQVPAEWGRLLNQSLETRSHALYDTVTGVTADDTQVVIELAQEILKLLERKLTND